MVPPDDATMSRTPQDRRYGRKNRHFRPAVQRLESRELLAVMVADGSFEAAVVGNGNFAYGPSGTPWAFSGSAGVTGNNSSFATGGQNAPDGQQAAFIQRAGSISQQVSGWDAGSYHVTFAASQRYGSNQDFQVLVDGSVVATFQPKTATSYLYYTTPAFTVADGTHIVTFHGLDSAGGDNVVLFDSVAVFVATAGVPTVNDPSFEQAPVGPGTYAYNPQDSYWNFQGSAGVSSDNSIFTSSNPSSPNGTHVAFIQGGSSLIQTVVDWSSANYHVSFSVAQGGLGDESGEGIRVLLDGVDVGDITPSSTSYQTYTTPDFPVTAGSHALSFMGVDPAGTGHTVLMDSVGVTQVPGQGGGPTPVGDGGDTGSGSPYDFTGYILTSYIHSGVYDPDQNPGVHLGQTKVTGVIKSPAHGVVTPVPIPSGQYDSAGHQLTRTGYEYKPDVGFFGQDWFVLSAEGPDYVTGLKINYKATISVHVNPPAFNNDLAGNDDLSADDPTPVFDDITSPVDKTVVLDKATIQWRVVGPNGTLDSSQTTGDGSAFNTLHSSLHVGDTYKVYSKIVAAAVDGGPLLPLLTGVEASDTVTVVPGTAANINFGISQDHLLSDGRSSATITIRARDAAGNVVAAGTPVYWGLEGSGSLLNKEIVTDDFGQAAVTLQAGTLVEDQWVSATVDGVQASIAISSQPIKIQVGITGQILRLGTSDTALVTAHVTDLSGNPVPDGTEVDWYTQKGTISGGAGFTINGQVGASLTAIGGSQIPGPGFVRAFVGGNSGSASYQWIVPSTGNLSASLDKYVISGDSKVPSTVVLDQPDGTTASYDVQASANGAIRGNPGDVVTLAIGTPDTPIAAYFRDAAGNNLGTTISDTLDDQGTGSFVVQSYGNTFNGGVSLPITLSTPSTFFSGGTSTTLTIALMPTQIIARAADLGKQIGWAVLTGNDNGSVVNMGADIAFSMLPVVGVYTDIRDIGLELLKLVPGGNPKDRFSWTKLGLSTAGILTTAVPPLDWVPTVAKKLLAVLRSDSIIGTAFLGMASQFNVSKLNDSKLFFLKLIDPSDDSKVFLNILDGTDDASKAILQSGGDVDGFVNIIKALGGTDEIKATLTRIVADPNLGVDSARLLVQGLGELSTDQITAIVKSGQLDGIASALSKGLRETDLPSYASWLVSRLITSGATTLNLTTFDAVLGTGMKQADVGHYLDVLGDVTVFRGSTMGFPGNPGMQAAGVSAASIDPIVATVYAALGASRGADPVVTFGTRANFGGTLGFGNVSPSLRTIEREVSVPLAPLDFAASAPRSISLDRSRAILAQIGFNVPAFINASGETKNVITDLPKMTPEQIKQFLQSASSTP